MGTSNTAGINAGIDADGWLIALADMPWIKSETIPALVDRLDKGATMMVPRFEQTRGRPVGFSSHWRDELLGLHAEKGARQLLNNHSDALELLKTNDSGVVSDIDVPEDLQQ